MNKTTVREILAVGFVGLALCIMPYNQAKVIAPIAPHSMQTFAGYALRIDFPAFDTEIGYVDLQKSWKPRILSDILGADYCALLHTGESFLGNRLRLPHLVRADTDFAAPILPPTTRRDGWGDSPKLARQDGAASGSS
jgi:hypothetical protein